MVRRFVYFRRERAEFEFIRFYFAGHRHSKQRASMEAAGENDDTLAFRIFACDFHGVFHRFRTAVQEHHLLLMITGCQFGKTFCQLDVRFVHHNVEAGMDVFIYLIMQCFHDFRCTVSYIDGTDCTCKIDKCIAIYIGKKSALGFFYECRNSVADSFWYVLFTTFKKFFSFWSWQFSFHVSEFIAHVDTSLNSK